MSFYRPTNLDDALTACARGGARVLAGGTDLFAATDRASLAGDIIDLTAVPDLGGVSRDKAGWRIGATTTFSQIIMAAPDLPRAFNGLRTAAAEVGSVQIQNTATLAGNLCNASPAADSVPPLLTLDAEVELVARAGTRRLPLAQFITGIRKTALRPGEIVAAIHIPEKSTAGHAAFVKLGARKYLVISIAMVAVRLTLSGGKSTSAAVAVGACSPVATRLGRLERAMLGCSPANAGAWATALNASIETDLAPIGDIRADAPYRRKAVAHLIDQAIQKAATQ